MKVKDLPEDVLKELRIKCPEQGLIEKFWNRDVDELGAYIDAKAQDENREAGPPQPATNSTSSTLKILRWIRAALGRRVP